MLSPQPLNTLNPVAPAVGACCTEVKALDLLRLCLQPLGCDFSVFLDLGLKVWSFGFRENSCRSEAGPSL